MLGFLVVVPIGIIFLISGLIVNVLQLLTLIFILPFSRKAYRILNRILLDSYWSQFVWLMDWWGCLEIRIYTEQETWDESGKENALLICNHRSDVDWLVGWVLAQRSGCLGGTRALMKDIIQYLPIIGWSMWFSEYLFLARDWVKDKKKIEASYRRLRDFPFCLWVALFVEGTRFTKSKLLAAQEFAKDNNIPVPRHTLVPRTKGFVLSVQNLREFVPIIYDVSLMVPRGTVSPTFLRLFLRKPSILHVHIRKVLMKDLPKEDEEIAKWCRDCFIQKDELLEKHIEINSFGEDKYLPVKRSVKPLINTIFWSVVVICIIAYGLYYAIQTNSLSWNTLLWVGAILIIIIVLIQILLMQTQSEHSTPAQKVKKSTPALNSNLNSSQRQMSESADGSRPHQD